MPFECLHQLVFHFELRCHVFQGDEETGKALVIRKGFTASKSREQNVHLEVNLATEC